MSDGWCPIARIYDPLKVGSIDGTDTEPHDHGIVRALQAEYRPNDLVVGDPKLTIFVAHLSPETTEKQIEKFFSRFGKIRRFRLVRDIVTGFSKRYAFVEYKDKQGALEAHRKAHRAELDGNVIFVDFECSRTLPGWIPRRLGGGFGGKKESGQLRFGGRDRLFKKPITLSQKFHDLHQENYYSDRTQNRSHNRYSERSYERIERKRKHRKHHRSRSRSRSRSRDSSRKRHKDKHK